MGKAGDLNADLTRRQYKLDKLAKFMGVKSTNPNLKQSEKAKELKISCPTLQRYRREKKMLSQYRIPPSSNTHTRKQKNQNHTEPDLKMTSIDHRVTSNDLKLSSNEPVKK